MMRIGLGMIDVVSGSIRSVNFTGGNGGGAVTRHMI